MGRGSAKGSSPKKKRRARKAPAERVASKRTAKAAPSRHFSAKSKSGAKKLAAELKAAEARQAATSEILRVISRSPADAQPVFDAIAESAKRLLGSHSAVVTRVIDGMIQFAAGTAEKEAAAHAEQGLLPYPLTSERIHARVARSGQLAINADAPNSDLPQNIKEFARTIGWRSMLVVPMLRDGVAIGTIGITRREAGEFDDKTIDLLKTFADQAVIAIENARLFNETREALERQAAMAQVLEVINSSPNDLTPVFDAVLERATRLCGASFGVLSIYKGNDMHQVVAHMGAPPGFAEMFRDHPIELGPGTGVGRLVRGESYVHIPDAADDDAYRSGHPVRRALVDIAGARTYLAVPIRRDDVMLGSFTVYRREVRLFSPDMIALLQSFAAQAAIAIDNARLFNETKEALERQTATAEILKVIASSPDDVQPVFEAIVASANRLIGGFLTAAMRFIDGTAHLAAFTPLNPEADAILQAAFPAPAAAFPLFKFAARGVPTQIEDTELFGEERLLAVSRARGFRSALYAPLMNAGRPIGVIGVSRAMPGSFAEHHVQLLQTFADQAVIAIENVRLFNETREALAHQTATSEVLQAIGSSMADTQPVFERILDSVERLFEIRQCSIILAREGMLHLVARRGIDIEDTDRLFPAPMAQTTGSEVIRTVRQTYVPSAMSPQGSSLMRRVAELMGDYSVVMTPLVWEGRGIGIISAARAPNAVFSEKEMALLRTFADQAVIAIENVRLFNETKQALERQTATADILKVIASSPDNVQPVFEAIAERANKLIGGYTATVLRIVGDMVDLDAFTPVSEEADAVLRASFPLPIKGNPDFDRLRRGEMAEIIDTESAHPEIRKIARARGFRSVLYAPLLNDRQFIGAISVARVEPGAFAAHHVQLLQTFADQAVIAIQNVRLFNETKEALQRQTATADILKVIASSPSDVKPVFDQILSSMEHLIKSDERVIVLAGDDGMVRVGAAHSARGDELYKFFPRPLRGSAVETVIGERRVLAFADALNDPEVPASLQTVASLSGARSVMMAPLLSESRAIGSIVVSRTTVDPFNEKEWSLLSTFADQAVIAIENVRLFNELQARTRDLSEALQQQTATADVLKVISRSAFDLQTVLDTLVESAARLCSAERGVIFQKDGDVYRLVANCGMSDDFMAYAIENPISVDRSSTTGRVALEGKTVHIPDVMNDPDYTTGYAQFGEYRTVLGVPLLREGSPIGSFSLTRSAPQPFTERQIELVQTFADQAVIAIENVRLFDEVQARTRELAASLEDLRTAQDRLVQTEKLASLGQLTAGIAHEIKNPLNFVNNFSALSAELTDELNDLLARASLTGKMREEVGELTRLLQDNLQKVVQHGKRADSIVKNMLLHSREGAGEQRAADINALVDESLNLAYHGARAEKFGFNITLQRDFDAGAGTAELFPQEITRALLNLISNGFYAATRRSAENGEAGFEPTLRAATKNLGSAVEIRIRDNGTGIPPEVKEKIFNPFFTTKPAGEGTGLGLSMTHDIIVKQHGGRIDVETRPGEYTEFIIVLPRAGSPRPAKA